MWTALDTNVAIRMNSLPPTSHEESADPHKEQMDDVLSPFLHALAASH